MTRDGQQGDARVAHLAFCSLTSAVEDRVGQVLRDRILRLAELAFLITAILGLAIAGFLATRFEGEIMGLEDVSQATPDSSQATADGFPAPMLERLVRDYQGVTYAAIAGGFVLLFITLTGIAVYG